MIVLVILAAGKSERYRKNKLLEKINDKTIIRKVVEEAVKSDADKVIVVVGYDATRIIKEVRDLPVTFVFNSDYEKGMSYSVKVGVKEAQSLKANAVMILPADNLLISSETINKVIDKYVKTKALIITPSYEGRRGHPILFDKKLFEDIMKISEETKGLKYVVRKYADKIINVNVNSPEIYIDIDYPEDLEKLRKKGLLPK